MASEMTMVGARPGKESFWQGDAFRALAAMLVVGAIAAAGGFGKLSGTADNDSMLRLVQVRDLVAGQGWFDLHQYRMGAEGGLLMHWSRLVDAPIAAIMLVATAVTGSPAAGETVALIAWPLLLFAAALYLLLRIGRELLPEEALFPLTILGAATLYYVGIFAPGAIDHHNLQLVLMLAMMVFLLSPGTGAGVAAGVAAVLMLAVGMETVPYVAVGGLFVSGWYLLRGEKARGATAGFGTAFAAASGAVFVATVPAAQWGAAYCDAFSVVQLTIGMVAGLGLALVAASSVLSASPWRRAGSLAALGAVVAVLAVAFYPQCLSGPYANLPPMMQHYWLDGIGEAQSILTMLANEPEATAGHYVTVLLALVIFARHMRRTGVRRGESLVAAMLVVALLVSIWQVRGSRFSLPLACLPLAMWVGSLRIRAQATPGAASSLSLAGAWLASFHVTWILASLGLWTLLAPAGSTSKPTAEACLKPADHALLAALPPTEVLVISNLGAPMLRYTPQSVLAGPYHRNVAGNLAALSAFTGSPELAAGVVRDNGVGLVAICRGNPETNFLARRAPDGMLAGMLAGERPDWLEIVPESAGQPLELYRVSLPGG
ncbi:GtrA family protein [Mesorhizobium marinum]|uniref:GtrA family protein n=1 Tax=Mesorhizobium marinum TaxID=3228790 RepID=UPI0034679593